MISHISLISFTLDVMGAGHLEHHLGSTDLLLTITFTHHIYLSNSKASVSLHIFIWALREQWVSLRLLKSGCNKSVYGFRESLFKGVDLYHFPSLTLETWMLHTRQKEPTHHSVCDPCTCAFPALSDLTYRMDQTISQWFLKGAMRLTIPIPNADTSMALWSFVPIYCCFTSLLLSGTWFQLWLLQHLPPSVKPHPSHKVCVH